MKRLVALLALVVSLGAIASPTEPIKSSLVLSGFSYHLGRVYTENGETKHFNEVNIGFGLEQDDWRWMLVKNSYSDMSVALMWVPKAELTETTSVGLRLGAATGYGDTPVNLELAPVVGIEFDYHFNNIHIVPAFQLPTVFTLHMQIDY